MDIKTLKAVMKEYIETDEHARGTVIDYMEARGLEAATTKQIVDNFLENSVNYKVLDYINSNFCSMPPVESDNDIDVDVAFVETVKKLYKKYLPYKEALDIDKFCTSGDMPTEKLCTIGAICEESSVIGNLVFTVTTLTCLTDSGNVVGVKERAITDNDGKHNAKTIVIYRNTVDTFRRSLNCINYLFTADFGYEFLNLE